MNKRIHILPLFIVLLIIGMLFTFTAHAAEEAPVVSDTPVVSTPEAPVVSTPETPVTSDPVVSTPETPVTSDPVVDPQPETPVTSDPAYVPEEPVVSDPVVSDSNTGNNYVDSYTNDEGYYYYDEEEMVNNIDDYAGNVSDYTSLYDTSDFDKEGLEESKWDDITIDTTKTSNADAMDFSAIKDNTSTDDDGQWILYTGYILIALSVIGILYYIIATATYKKKLKALASRNSASSNRRSSHSRARSDYGDSDDYSAPRSYSEHRRSSSSSRTNRTRRYASDNTSYSERKRRKADTAEINL